MNTDCPAGALIGFLLCATLMFLALFSSCISN